MPQPKESLSLISYTFSLRKIEALSLVSSKLTDLLALSLASWTNFQDLDSTEVAGGQLLDVVGVVV